MKGGVNDIRLAILNALGIGTVGGDFHNDEVAGTGAETCGQSGHRVAAVGDLDDGVGPLRVQRFLRWIEACLEPTRGPQYALQFVPLIMREYDAVVVGGGIVGLSVAWELTKRGLEVGVLEKEPELACHQTGRNSGVIHSGVYYRPGSLKARNCRKGKALLERFCEEHGIPYKRSGKVIVAVSQEEVPRLRALHERARANGVQCELIGSERLKEIEPHAAGVEALWVPETGVVDFKAVCLKLAELVGKRGEVVLSAEVLGIRRERGRVFVETSAGDFASKLLVNCAGLQCDRVARLAGDEPQVRIVPFKGEYYELAGRSAELVRSLIYPVPDPRFPFLGVHLTRHIDGKVDAGPSAVLALAREGYRKLSLNFKDLAETLSFPGFWKLISRHAVMGAAEVWRSAVKAAFARAVQRLVPEVDPRDMRPAEPGIRAQAVAPDGSLVDDFVIQRSDGVVHVLNAPSPAATAALAIAQEVAKRALAT